jgi:hypothetical protein
MSKLEKACTIGVDNEDFGSPIKVLSQGIGCRNKGYPQTICTDGGVRATRAHTKTSELGQAGAIGVHHKELLSVSGVRPRQIGNGLKGHYGAILIDGGIITEKEGLNPRVHLSSSHSDHQAERQKKTGPHPGRLSVYHFFLQVGASK